MLQHPTLRHPARAAALLSLAALLSFADDPAADAYRRAHACLASNRFSEAAARFQTATASSNAAAAAAAWLGRGEAFYGAGQWPAAAAAYDALLARYPASALAPNALCGRGFAETRAGLLPQALATFTALAETYPGHALAPTAAASTGALARTLAAHMRQRQTETLSREIAAINDLIRDGRHAEASVTAERFLRAHPDSPQDAELRLIAADGAFRAHDWPRAETLLSGFLSRHPQHVQAPRARLELGQALEALSRFDEAAEVFSRSTAPDAPLRVAGCLYRSGRYEEALKRYDELARNAADLSAAARAALASGDCHAALKNWPAAERAFLSVEVLHDADALRPAALARLAGLYDNMGQTNRADRARDALKRRYPDYTGEPGYSSFGVER
jgi:TolA-binding protein